MGDCGRLNSSRFELFAYPCLKVQSSASFLPPQVRWGDKHGGYGEQYWEYNHAPKHVDHKHVDTYHPPPKYHAAAA